MQTDKLWQDFLGGSKKSLSLIFLEFYDDLHSYGMKFTNSTELTEDSLQDLFLKLWVNRQNLKGVKNIKAYLLTSLRNTLINNIKWQNKGFHQELKEGYAFNADFSAEDIMISKQVDANTRNELIQAINSLPTKQKEVIYLRYYESLDFESIASIMGITIQSARNYIQRGLIELRKLEMKHP